MFIGGGHKKKNMFNRTKKQEGGFTIIELMIALSVFSVMLLVSTLVILQLGRLYTKGVNQSNLQNATRTVSDDIGSAIEFGGHKPITGSRQYPHSSGQNFTVQSLCVGTLRYSYVLQRKLGTDAETNLTFRHVLWKDTVNPSGSCDPLNILGSGSITDRYGNIVTNGYEMMPPNSSISALVITPVQFTQERNYSLSINTAYGDSDLIAYQGSPAEPRCIGGLGSQFCATALFNTVVSKRLK